MTVPPVVALEYEKLTFAAKCKKTFSKLIDSYKVICHFTTATYVDPKLRQTLRKRDA